MNLSPEMLRWLVLGAVVLILALPSIRIIGPTEVGVVTKRFSWRRLSEPAARQANGALPRALPWADLARERPLARGATPMQSALARARVNVDIQNNNATARKAEADGEAAYIRETGAAKGAEVEAVGLARAKGYEAQVRALGQGPTALVNVVGALADKAVKFVPEVLVTGSDASGAVSGLAAVLMRQLGIRPEQPPPSAATEGTSAPPSG